ncbi:MAG: UvrD-helicase domain-containing protein [Bacteroidia bacterium]|nr:UvrD-helicase domain-containing protein [Bacteroidia bacterium]
MDLLQALNKAQKAAVEQIDGPVMVVAGAGSGKTRVLTYKLAYIVEKGLADARELMALTFTNKAAREMRERIQKLIGPAAKDIWMGTFHSIFAKILRFEAEKIGYTSAFTIYDTEDSLNLIKTIMKELRIDEKDYKPRAIQSRISLAKNNLINAAEFERKYADNDFGEKIAKVFQIYENRTAQANAMDFDDLLVKPLELFQAYPNILEKYQTKFKFFLVDEYQDTNYAQYLITKKLSAKHKNLCVVGDDAQSIYSFRGATIENILNFKRDNPTATVIQLEQNYRSTQIIVQAANYIIKKNQKQLEKNVFTENEIGEKIRVLIGENDQEEAQKIADLIREYKMRYNLANHEIAILYRTNNQSRALEDALRKAGIPYKIFGGLSFYRRKEVKDVVAYLRLAVNPNDEESLKRIINYPARGIGETTMERILSFARQESLSIWEAVLRAKEAGIGRSLAPVEGFVKLIQNFQNYVSNHDAYQSVAYIARESGILKDLFGDKTPEGISRQKNVEELINAAQEFVDDETKEGILLSDFLNEVALFTDADEKTENIDYVSLMTIHASKGLEFKAIFVAGLEEGLFPSNLSISSPAELEEERRLFYVALTRAEKYLVLSYAKMRYKFGSQENARPSRFLEEMNPQHLEFPPNVSNSKKQVYLPKEQANSFRTTNFPPTLAEDFVGDDLTNLANGNRVLHNKFGIGTVQKIEHSGDERRAIVQFENKLIGTKVLLLKYAKLKILG